MKFLIVAAKTGGHIFPAAAVADEIKKNNYELVFLGTGSGIEERAYKKFNSLIHKIQVQGYRGKSILKKLKVILQLPINILKVIKIIKKEKIDAMIGFGGFITVPAGVACYLMNIPIFIHEQNAVMGSANKVLSKMSKINFLGMRIKNIKNSIHSGNPIRTEFFQSSDADSDGINIYITGGSQGANYINEKLPNVLSKFTNINVKHQCGKNNISKVQRLYKKNGLTAEIHDFYENPAEQILWSDFVISRAGALSLSEISSLQRGILMIPLPTAIDNHQFENAKSIVELGMGEIHQQNDSIEKLKSKIENIISNQSYVNWKKQGNKDHKNAVKVITESIFKLLN
ncbi:UDP-N-acetylglucosamine--N-acetylmuramyl-(pentapeptide) pyrophosphoryl-undecaprenol N-acetylglucosamine transferase [Gammaproteobacteria bacterium]|nr:UDP-N-acetylglucosamine--N-acetylmuramyl-(pentapeptide) pyrophosphoryl-undecaprenol N-acetylglucosamine transferase [Gammaproteobacteria bacterium]